MQGHWSIQEKQFLVWIGRSNFRFHLYDFRSIGAEPPPDVPAAVAAIHGTARDVAPLSQVEAFLGTPDNIDWGGDAADWRRAFLADQRRVTGVLRVVDDFTGRVTPLKVFDVENAAVRTALDEMGRATGAAGEQVFAIQEAVYEKYLKGTSVTKYKWFCVAKGIARGAPTFLPFGTAGNS
jgi:hypothetical protein